MIIVRGEEDDRESAFDSLLQQSIEEVVTYVLGEYSWNILYSHLKRNGFDKEGFPNNLVIFQDTIYKAIGQYLTPAPLLLRCVVGKLCEKMDVECDEEKSYHFLDYIIELKKEYVEKEVIKIE